jgi:hypothetical protein
MRKAGCAGDNFPVIPHSFRHPAHRERNDHFRRGAVDPGTRGLLPLPDNYCAPANAGAQGSRRSAPGSRLLRAQEHTSLFLPDQRQIIPG